MMAYLPKVQSLLSKFETWQIQQVFQVQNAEAYSLAKLALTLSSEFSRMILVECLNASSIQDKELLPLITNSEDGWQASIVSYLHDGVKLTSKEEARKLRYRTSHYVLIDNTLYRWGHSLPLLRCLNYEEADYVLRDIHEGICSNHLQATHWAIRCWNRDIIG